MIAYHTSILSVELGCLYRRVLYNTGATGTFIELLNLNRSLANDIDSCPSHLCSCLYRKLYRAADPLGGIGTCATVDQHFVVTILRCSSTRICCFLQDSASYESPEIARHHGYLCETHRVTTEDKFILQIHRLPGGKSTVLNTSLTPVLLQHGLLDSSAAWVISGPDKALARAVRVLSSLAFQWTRQSPRSVQVYYDILSAGYLLADQGYDVWMGNARGNIYSKAHETLHPDDPNFWNWTWDEMGRYDLPAVIDYILQVTGHQQILYIGHSMGTTMFFVLCSSRPEYNAKVRYMAALAPVAYMGHTTSPLRYLAPYAQSFEVINNFCISIFSMIIIT
ncbi:hypothetical protein J6590_092468 [Homalodisca vitripennis]|nr:hypothetical protein J6590_092468 [Homalodisca vitripennis]